jgi:glucose-1-phosphate adenylyltransferase
MLPPNDNDNPYKGTADAIYRNIDFIESFDPECVLVIPANQICRMDYNTMLTFHRDSGANATIATTAIYENGALKSPMVNVGKYGRVFDFNEKPQQPRNLLTSMGVYIFQWDILKEYLTADSINTVSEHDFEKNILPVMLYMGEPIFAYRFEDYWRGIGTIESLWEANMEHLANPYAANWQDSRAPVLSCAQPETCKVKGEIKNSTLGDYVTVGKNSEVVSSVIMPNACIGENVKIHNTIVGVRAEIMDGIEIGCDDGIDFFVDRNVCSNGVSLVAPWVRVPGGMRFQKGSHIHKRRLDEMGPVKDKQSADAGFSNKIFK